MERAFRGVWIMAEVWMDERLNALDKMILAEVDSLDNEDGCYASNQHLAQFCQCTERKVSQSITKLVELGYIRRESFDGRTRILRSNLPKTTRLPGSFFQADTKKIPPENTNRDTGIRDTCNKGSRKPVFTAPSLDEVSAYVKEMGYSMLPEAFFDYYESVGWTVGKGKPMKDWKASVRRWEAREQEEAAERRRKKRVEGFDSGSFIQYR